MPSLNYEEIYSKFRLKASAYDLLDLRDDDLNVFLCDWMHSAIHNRIFTDYLPVLNFMMKFSNLITL